MNIKVILLSLIFVCGCVVQEPGSEIYNEELWVCHNPESPMHGQPCREEVDPYRGRYEACYWTRLHDAARAKKHEDAFCWLIRKEDCEVSDDAGSGWLEWQEVHCPLLEK